MDNSYLIHFRNKKVRFTVVGQRGVPGTIIYEIYDLQPILYLHHKNLRGTSFNGRKFYFEDFITSILKVEVYVNRDGWKTVLLIDKKG